MSAYGYSGLNCFHHTTHALIVFPSWQRKCQWPNHCGAPWHALICSCCSGGCEVKRLFCSAHAQRQSWTRLWHPTSMQEIAPRLLKTFPAFNLHQPPIFDEESRTERHFCISSASVTVRLCIGNATCSRCPLVFPLLCNTTEERVWELSYAVLVNVIISHLQILIGNVCY